MSKIIDDSLNEAVISINSALNRTNTDLVNEICRLTDIVRHYRNVLEKIADPRLRDHQEPDTYTQLACVMNMAHDALNYKL